MHETAQVTAVLAMDGNSHDQRGLPRPHLLVRDYVTTTCEMRCCEEIFPCVCASDVVPHQQVWARLPTLVV